jgi:hypothetical protein
MRGRDVGTVSLRLFTASNVAVGASDICLDLDMKFQVEILCVAFSRCGFELPQVN